MKKVFKIEVQADGSLPGIPKNVRTREGKCLYSSVSRNCFFHLPTL